MRRYVWAIRNTQTDLYSNGGDWGRWVDFAHARLFNQKNHATSHMKQGRYKDEDIAIVAFAIDSKPVEVILKPKTIKPNPVLTELLERKML